MVLNKILRGISVIQNQIEDLNTTLLQRSDVDGIEKFGIINELLPVHNIDDLKKVESFIKENKQNEELLKKFVSRIGGSNVKDNVGRVYKNVFTNSFAVKCSWLGLRENYKISSSVLIKIINCVALDMYSTSQKDFETASSEWFRLAKQRLKREKNAV